MNTYILFVDNKSPFYVKASFSFQAVNWLENRYGFKVSAWDIATSLPQGACVFDSNGTIVS